MNICSDEAANLAQVVTAVTAIVGLVLVVIGWKSSKKAQIEANRHNNMLTAMREYQSLLQSRYEDMLISIVPLVTASDIYKYSLDHPDQKIKRSAKALFEDAKGLEKGFLPYYFTLQANCHFDTDTVNDHANKMQACTQQLRTMIGYYQVDKDTNLPDGAVKFLIDRVTEFTTEAYYFMLNLNCEMKAVIETGNHRYEALHPIEEDA